jgi:Uma2 family endonuclease
MMATVIDAPVGNLTYETYMAEPQVEGRYDIINGMRVFMLGASWDHQTISGNLYDALKHYSRTSKVGKALYSPFDVLIQRLPKLQTRQPDLLFISNTRLARGGGISQSGPLSVAPELVVEIISNSETQRILDDKVADYGSICVEECWVIRPETRTIELLQPSLSGSQVIATFDETQSVNSLVFPDLVVPVEDLFQP